MGIFASGQTLTASKLNAITNGAGLNNATGSGSTGLTSYVDFPATSSFSFTKIQAATIIKIDFHTLCYTTQSGDVASFGVRINGTDYEVCRRSFSASSVIVQASGTKRIPSIPAGTYTVQIRYKRQSGSGSVTIQANDWVSCDATEVQS